MTVFKSRDAINEFLEEFDSRSDLTFLAFVVETERVLDRWW
jgi:hypothetical protein